MKPSDQARWQGIVSSWIGQGGISLGVKNNPVNGLLLFDSGVLGGGWYDFTINLSGDANHWYMQIQFRNAANDTTLYYLHTSVLAYNAFTFHVNNWYINTNERVRLIVINNATGNFIGDILWSKRV